MTKLLEQAIEAARRLSPTEQDELAALINRRVIEARLAESDASYAVEGGAPAATFFDRLEKKYGG